MGHRRARVRVYSFVCASCTVGGRLAALMCALWAHNLLRACADIIHVRVRFRDKIYLTSSLGLVKREFVPQ